MSHPSAVECSGDYVITLNKFLLIRRKRSIGHLSNESIQYVLHCNTDGKLNMKLNSLARFNILPDHALMYEHIYYKELAI